MDRKLIFILLFLLIHILSIKSSVTEKSFFPDLIGLWLSENKKQKIRVSYDAKTQTYKGIIEWMYEDDPKTGTILYDVKNPNPKLRTRRVTGIPLLYDIQFENGNKFKGRVYDPPTGNDYKCTLTLAPDRKTVIIRAYFLTPLIGRTEKATKIIE